MARYSRRRKKSGGSGLILLLALAVILFGCYKGVQTGYAPADQIILQIHDLMISYMPEIPSVHESHQVNEPLTDPSTMKVHFIDVGQADCLYAEQGGHTLLVDGGNIEDGPLVAKYLTELGVDHLDYVIVTHAHEDHCGGIDSILYSIPCRKLILPNREIESWVYQSIIDAANKTGVSMQHAVEGETKTLGAAKFTVLCCDTGSPENLNESSIVCRLSYGNIDFMLTGDAEALNENEILTDGYTVDCEILKAGHHGSNTSNTMPWLKAVNPEVVVISVGENNDYYLPHKSVLNNFNTVGASVLRTDTMGTIIVETNGSNYFISSMQTDTDAAA